jgi:hypothetical protein
MGDEATADEQRMFDNKCLRLRQDDPTLTFVNDGPELSDGHICTSNHILLGQSLLGNTNLGILAFRNPILEEGAARSLSQGVAQSKVERVIFVLSIGTKRQQEKLWRILFEGIRSMPNLKTLFLFGATSAELIVPYICQHISSIHSLRELTVACAKGCQWGFWLLQILVRTSSLTDLHFSVQDLGVIGVTLLAVGLRCNTSVTTLQMSSSFDDQSLELFLELWQPSSPIRKLSLFNNEIGLRGAQQLTRAIADHPTMQVLHLQHNNKLAMKACV